MKTKIEKIEQEIASIKKEMFEIGDMRPGSLTKQMRKAKEKYGAYWQLSYTYRGKGRTGYVREECADQVKEETRNYKRYKKLADRLIKLSIEKSTLKMALGKMKSVASK
jgi:hypothetical protein